MFAHLLQITGGRIPEIDRIAEDILVLKDPSNPEWMWAAEVSEVDGRYLLVSISKDTSRVSFSVVISAAS